MTSPSPPVVECEKMHVTLPVSDLAAAIEFYVAKLGFRLGFTWGEPAFFAGVTLGEVEIFLREGTPAPNAGVEPHTKAQLKYIEELKKKRGIDYDSHGRYRFVEE